MSILRSAQPARAFKIASISLVALSTLLSGCSSTSTVASLAGRLSHRHFDTDWHTTSTYASAIHSLSPRSASHAAHVHACFAEPCSLRMAVGQPHPSHRRTM